MLLESLCPKELGTHFTCFTGTKVQILTQRKVKVSQLWVEKYRPTKVSDIAGHKAQVWIRLRHTRRRIRLDYPRLLATRFRFRSDYVTQDAGLD